jgi:hypothetical protein
LEYGSEKSPIQARNRISIPGSKKKENNTDEKTNY